MLDPTVRPATERYEVPLADDRRVGQSLKGDDVVRTLNRVKQERSKRWFQAALTFGWS